jgi:hypothetical protein
MQSEVVGATFYNFWPHSIFFKIIHTEEQLSYNCVMLQYQNTLAKRVRSVSDLRLFSCYRISNTIMALWRIS